MRSAGLPRNKDAKQPLLIEVLDLIAYSRRNNIRLVRGCNVKSALNL